MIKRNGPKDYQHVSRLQSTERSPEDFDLRFVFEEGTQTTIYVLDKGEYFLWNRNVSEGPGLVMHEITKQGSNCSEYHVNDPRIWCWVQKRIKDGTFASNSQCVYETGEYIDVKPMEPKKAKAVK
jgi:hypothetical protein